MMAEPPRRFRAINCPPPDVCGPRGVNRFDSNSHNQLPIQSLRSDGEA